MATSTSVISGIPFSMASDRISLLSDDSS